MRHFVLAAILAAGCATVRADFTYVQTTQMTGGAAYNLMRNLGPLARGAREPVVTTHILKGNRLASITKDQTTIIDLDKESITIINTDKKTYAVMTFAQMKQAMEDALARAQAQKAKSGASADLNYKASAKATGQTKTVNGLNAKEVVMTLEAEVKDQKSGQTGA